VCSTATRGAREADALGAGAPPLRRCGDDTEVEAEVEGKVAAADVAACDVPDLPDDMASTALP
jgi:hypothetical protein